MFGVGRDLGHLVQPPCRSRVTYTRLHRTLSRRVLNISRGDSTTSLGNLFHMAGGFLGCSTKPLKKSTQLWKFGKSPMISLGADFNLTLCKYLTLCRMADTNSPLHWWTLPWAPHTGRTSMEVHGTVSGQCWWELHAPAARWEEVTLTHRSSLLHFQLTETIWTACLFLGRMHSCSGNIRCTLDRMHNLPSHRQVSLLSPPSAITICLTSSQKTFGPCRWLPWGTCLTGVAWPLAGPHLPDPSWRSDDLVRSRGIGFSGKKLSPLRSVSLCQPRRFWVIPAYCTKAQTISGGVSL